MNKLILSFILLCIPFQAFCNNVMIKPDYHYTAVFWQDLDGLYYVRVYYDYDAHFFVPSHIFVIDEIHHDVNCHCNGN